jgi:hypothetical protein
VGLWIFLNLSTFYLTGLRFKDEIRGAARYSNILLKLWKKYGRDHFGISKITVVY